MEDEGWERFAVLSARLLFEDFILLKRNYSFVRCLEEGCEIDSFLNVDSSTIFR